VVSTLIPRRSTSGRSVRRTDERLYSVRRKLPAQTVVGGL
jgi:hypothetical protein